MQIASVNGYEADQAQIDFYMDHITDGFVQVFGEESVATCAENAPDCIGEPLVNPRVDLDTVEIDGDSGTLTVVADDGSFVVQAIKEDGDWKLDGLGVANDEIPDGVETVNLVLDEFSFAFNMNDENVTSGNFAFHVTNAGDQVHEVGLIKLPDEGDVLDLLSVEDPEAAGVEFVTFKLPFQPGDEADMAIPELSAGRYALVCFFPDTDDAEFTPHAFKGMTAEFTVQ